MYAVIEDRGRQYKAAPGDQLQLNLREATPGATFELPVLLLAGDDGSVKVGAPRLAGAKAVVKVVSHGLGDKIIVGKYKRRKHSRRRHGFRAQFTTVEVVSIA